jgi:predicted DNA-binding helix-hairpin-helix protein
MDATQKLNLLGGEASFDLSCSCGMEPSRTRSNNGHWIYPAALPDGKSIRMLKVLQDNSCKNDCTYCAQRAGRNTRRDRFEPEELAKIFHQLCQANMVEGLFLSSGIGCDSIKTMDRILATTEIIRRRYKFFGFIHLKILPGAEYAQIEQAARLAQRISINMEAPNPKRLKRLSKNKDLQADILLRMKWIAKIVSQKKFRAKGHTTQFVVGAADESDSEIVSKVFELYKDYKLTRAYYSKFSPIPDTPLENLEPVEFMREHRLYQVDFLLRKYGFEKDEILFGRNGNLSIDEDPKTVWAKAHPEFFPIEINRAEPQQLLKVPGIGPLTVKRIINARKSKNIKYLTELKKLGGVTKHASPYLLFNGTSGKKQLSFWQS